MRCPRRSTRYVKAYAVRDRSAPEFSWRRARRAAARRSQPGRRPPRRGYRLTTSLASLVFGFGDCDLWLDGDRQPSVITAPETTAAWGGWAPVLCSLVGNTLTCVNDAAPQIHYASITPALAQNNKLCTIEVELKAGGLGARAGHWVRVQWGSVPTPNACYVYVNLATGAIGSKGGGVVSVTFVETTDGYRKLTLYGRNTTAPVYIVAANTDSGVGAGGAGDNTDITFDADGTESFEMRNFSAEIKYVGQWDDRSGQGHHVTQANAALKPVWRPSASEFNGRGTVRWDGIDDFLASANSDWTGVTGCTVFVVARHTSGAVLGEPICKGAAATSGFDVQFRSEQQIALGGVQGGVGLNFDGTGAGSYPSPNGIPLLFSGTVDTTQAAANENSLWVQGFAQTKTSIVSTNLANIGANNTFVVGGRLAAYFGGDIAEIIVFKKVLNASQRRQIELLLAIKYDILTDQRPMTVPTQYPGLAAWWKGSLGVTVRVPESFADATGWTTTNTSIAGTTITGSNDGAPAQHWIQRATTGAQVGHYATLTLKLKAGVLGARAGNWARVDWGASTGLSAYVNLATGALGTLGAGTTLATITDAGGGWWLVTLGGIIATSTTLFIMLAEADNDVSYDGDGTETILMSDVTADQDLVSVWADQSGNGRNFLQAASANQPDWGATYGPNNKPALKFDSVDDFMTAAFTLVQPEHVIFIGKMDTAAVNPSMFDGGAGVGNRMRLFATGVGPAYGGTWMTSDGANTVLVVHDPESGFKFYSCRFNTTASRQKVTGVTAVAGNAGVNGGGGMRLNTFGSGGGAAGITTPEVMLFSRNLSIAEEAIIGVYSNGEYGVAA